MSTVAALAVRLAVLVLVWWALLEGRTYLWPAAVPALAAAIAAGWLLAPPGRGRTRLRLRAVPAFAAAFLAGSASGALDVASRAFRRRVPLDPVFVEHELRLAAGAPRHLFAATVSLLPGTLSARLEGSMLTVHVLDRDLGAEETLAALERRVAALFGETLPGRP